MVSPFSSMKLCDLNLTGSCVVEIDSYWDFPPAVQWLLKYKLDLSQSKKVFYRGLWLRAQRQMPGCALFTVSAGGYLD